MCRTLQDWFTRPTPPVTPDYNAPQITRHILGGPGIDLHTPPLVQVNLNSYNTDASALYNVPRTTLYGR